LACALPSPAGVGHDLARAILCAFVVVLAVVVPAGPVGAQAVTTSADPRIDAALSLLAEVPATSQLPGVLESSNVDIHFLPMAPGVYARYNVARHVIEIDERWVDSDIVTLAAVIAHEATHAQDAVNGYLATGGAGACIDSEIRAFRNSALFWIGQYGPVGKVAPATDLEVQLNSIADRQQRDPQGLEALVRQTYSVQCSH
jgi:hypothetical protein